MALAGGAERDLLLHERLRGEAERDDGDAIGTVDEWEEVAAVVVPVAAYHP
jgi:hypothetical protein